MTPQQLLRHDAEKLHLTGEQSDLRIQAARNIERLVQDADALAKACLKAGRFSAEAVDVVATLWEFRPQTSTAVNTSNAKL